MLKEWLAEHSATAAMVGGALLVGFLLATLIAKPPPPPIEIRTREPQPSPTTVLFVHVEGAVAEPGVYRLNGDARIFDAVDAAGGATDDANVSVLNLAARVTDGQKLVVPMRAAGADTSVASTTTGTVVVSSTSPGAPTTSGARINVNTASQRVLESLPGIGPVTAQRIIQYRTTNGPFTRVDQLRNAGVTAATFERIKDLVSVE